MKKRLKQIAFSILWLIAMSGGVQSAPAGCNEWMITKACAKAGLDLARRITTRRDDAMEDVVREAKTIRREARKKKRLPKKIRLAARTQIASIDPQEQASSGFSNMFNDYVDYTARHSKFDLSGFPGPLVMKVAELRASCGATVISAFRPGAKVCSQRGRCSASNHALKKAVDLKGNPSCMTARLQGWPGGYSTDYYRVNHIHISYNPNGKEWGARFAHNGRSIKGRRHAARNRMGSDLSGVRNAVSRY